MNNAKSKSQRRYFFKKIESPVGRLNLAASDEGLAAVLWEKDNPRRVRLGILAEDQNHPLLLKAEKQLNEYFAGTRTSFDLPLEFAGTQFQNQVWNALLEIPFGETRTYGQIAKQLGKPNAMRAVGAANGKNPISIIAPCHRVIGANGDLTGFAGGLGAKRYLLGMERSVTLTPAQTD